MRWVVSILLSLLASLCLANQNDPDVSIPEKTGQLGYTVASRSPKEEHVVITIVYDNVEHDSRLKTAWGYSCLVERDGTRILFDTGGEGPTLLENMRGLAIDEEAIDAVVLSHEHWDHIGGLEALLKTGAQPTVFVPQSFSTAFKREVAKHASVVEVQGNCSIAPGIHTTGEVVSAIPEQALVVETVEGIVVITGCAHPGIVEMVKRAKHAVPGEVRLVMGGFHLGGAPKDRIDTITREIMNLNVQGVAPSHCTGELARTCLEEAFGARYAASGVGWRIRLPSEQGDNQE
jgi:7,8-dihydropterin-6-yl-methyl-4-(beta-D-ribofuranosyl)aminobenzene 5'-phosphate synthase